MLRRGVEVMRRRILCRLMVCWYGDFCNHEHDGGPLRPPELHQLHMIFGRHFDEFCYVYDEKYAVTHGMFRPDRIRDICERFLTCGDYRLGGAGVASISGARCRCP